MTQKSDQGSVGTGATPVVPGTPSVAPAPACEIRPDPELVERPKRRQFSADYKLRILGIACFRGITS